MLADDRNVPKQIVRLHDPAVGLEGVIAIHSTALGAGAGGCRFWRYESFEDLCADAFRLAEGMSYKNALADLPFGGAKAVLNRPICEFDRAALFSAFGRAVAELGGSYVTAEDVGTSIADMEVVASATRHVAGLTSQPGRAGGDPSPWTALGVFEAMRSAARLTLGAEIADLTVAVQGTGNVGWHLCEQLIDAGAALIIADIASERRDRLAARYGARIVEIGEIGQAEADVFAPCALGGAITPQLVPQLRAKLVCGGANNQLAGQQVAGMLLGRGITYVPDYVANAGGIINVSAEYLGESADEVEARVRRIGTRVEKILSEAASGGISPAVVADRMARERIAAATQPAV